MAKAKAETKAKTETLYTSLYLGSDSKKKLIALAKASGKSRSEVVRDLIEHAGSEDKVRLCELVEEMRDLVSAT